MRIRSLTIHSLQAVLKAGLIAMLATTLVAGSAFAAKGGQHASTGTTVTTDKGHHHDRTDTSTTTTVSTSTTTASTKGHSGGGGGGGGHKGGGGSTSGTGTLALQMVTDWNTDGLPNWGDWVTFTISTTATAQPWVDLKCSVNGVVVSEMWNGYFVGSLTGTTFGLYSPQWTGGPADCTAYLTNPQWTVLGSTSFHVNG